MGATNLTKPNLILRTLYESRDLCFSGWDSWVQLGSCNPTDEFMWNVADQNIFKRVRQMVLHVDYMQGSEWSVQSGGLLCVNQTGESYIFRGTAGVDLIRAWRRNTGCGNTCGESVCSYINFKTSTPTLTSIRDQQSTTASVEHLNM